MSYSLRYTYDKAAQHYLVAGWADITPTDKVIIPSAYDDGIHSVHPVGIIGVEAFKDCETLTSIIIPYSVKILDSRSFYGCKNLMSINIPYGVTKIDADAFAFCTSLTSIAIPDSVTSLGVAVFNGCTSLKNLIISDKLEDINGYMFQDCTSLTNITIPDSIASIGYAAFLRCNSLTSVTIGKGVTSIGDYAFQSCSKLTSVTIPDSVKSIGEYAFADCSGLTSVTIGNGVTSIDAGAFHCCDNLTSITIPDSVTSIGSNAFAGCTELKIVVLLSEIPRTLGYNAIPTTISTIYVQQSSKETYKMATDWASVKDQIVSDNTYLSFVRFNRKNKVYIQEQVENIYKTGFDKAVLIAYSSLVTLRDNAKLVAGTWYRITDYVTTTAQAESRSVGHAFDVIVLAIDKNRFDENAFATQHEGDKYFANSKLGAWKLKYCIDNDTARFAWASSSGKGVIYELIDEFENKCGYDFKNIQFKRYKITKYQRCPGLVNGYYGALEVGDNSVSPYRSTISQTDPIWRFTFDLNGTDISMHDEGCYGNEIFPYVGLKNSFKRKQFLNNVVFLNTSSRSCYRNRLVGANIFTCTFGNDCYSNTFGNDCYCNTFGNNCCDNTFGDGCYYNSFADICSSNSFGDYCGSNTFGNSCYHNSFGDNCYANTFGNSCNSNTFGTNCGFNTFGNSCSYNTLDGNNNYLSLTYSSDSSTNVVQYHHFTVGFSGASEVNQIECLQDVNAISEYIFYKPGTSVWSCRYYSGTTDISINLKYKTSVADTAWTVGNTK